LIVVDDQISYDVIIAVFARGLFDRLLAARTARGSTNGKDHFVDGIGRHTPRHLKRHTLEDLPYETIHLPPLFVSRSSGLRAPVSSAARRAQD
jgi:hypothetical protein